MAKGQQITLANNGENLVTAADSSEHKAFGILNPNDGIIYVLINGQGSAQQFDYIVPPESYGIYPGSWTSLGFTYVDQSGAGQSGSFILYTDDSYQLQIPSISAIGRAIITNQNNMDLVEGSEPAIPGTGIVRLWADTNGDLNKLLPGGQSYQFLDSSNAQQILEQVISADVTISNVPGTFTDIVTINLTQGNWLLWADTVIFNGSAAASISLTGRLYDGIGGGDISATSQYVGTNQIQALHLTGQVSLGGNTAVKLQVNQNGTNTGVLAKASDQNYGQKPCTHIVALRVS